MIYKINITNSDGELIEVIEINPTVMNWDSDPTARLLGREILNEIKKEVKNEHTG